MSELEVRITRNVFELADGGNEGGVGLALVRLEQRQEIQILRCMCDIVVLTHTCDEEYEQEHISLP